MIESKSLPHPFQEVLREEKKTFWIPFHSPHHNKSWLQVTKEVCVAKVTEGKRKKAV